MTFTVRALTVLVLAGIAASVVVPVQASPTIKVYEFYAYTYGNGVPVHNSVCFCQVGPCPQTYELVGGYVLNCGGQRAAEWGYTTWNGQCGVQNYPTDRVLVSTMDCDGGASAAQSSVSMDGCELAP